METVPNTNADKVYKTAIYTRNAVKRYQDKRKSESLEKYQKYLEYQRIYYQKRKEQLKQYKELLEQNNLIPKFKE